LAAWTRSESFGRRRRLPARVWTPSGWTRRCWTPSACPSAEWRSARTTASTSRAGATRPTEEPSSAGQPAEEPRRARRPRARVSTAAPTSPPSGQALLLPTLPPTLPPTLERPRARVGPTRSRRPNFGRRLRARELLPLVLLARARAATGATRPCACRRRRGTRAAPGGMGRAATGAPSCSRVAAALALASTDASRSPTCTRWRTR